MASQASWRSIGFVISWIKAVWSACSDVTIFILTLKLKRIITSIYLYTVNTGTVPERITGNRNLCFPELRMYLPGWAFDIRIIFQNKSNATEQALNSSNWTQFIITKKKKRGKYLIL